MRRSGAHLVPEAARDLVVAVDAGDHEHLLEQLRRLRQGVPVARLDPARRVLLRLHRRRDDSSGTTLS